MATKHQPSGPHSSQQEGGSGEEGRALSSRAFLQRCTGYFYLCSTAQKLTAWVHLAARGARVFILGDDISSPNQGFLYLNKQGETVTRGKLAVSKLG